MKSFRYIVSILLIIILVLIIQRGYASVLSTDTTNRAKELNDLGRNNLIKGNFDLAEDQLLNAIREDPLNYSPYNNLGIFSRIQGKYEEALNYFNSAEKVLLKHPRENQIELAKIYNNKGIVYKDKGDYFQALKYYHNALNLLLDKPTEITRVGQIYNNLGIIYLLQNKDSLALNVFKKSIEIKKELKPSALSVAYANCATAYIGLGNLDLAEEYYLKSIQNKIKYNGETFYKLAESYSNFGLFKILQGFPDDGLALFQKAHYIIDKNFNEDSPLHTPIYLNEGDYFLEIERFDEALDSYQQAIIHAVDGFNNPDIYQNPGIDQLYADIELVNIFSGKALTMFRYFLSDQSEQDLLIESLKTHGLLISFIEKTKGSYLDQKSKLLFAQNVQEILNQALIVAYNTYTITGEKQYLEMAFSFAEKSKAALLSSALSDVENKKNYGIPAETQKLEKDILAESDFYDKKLYQEGEKSKPDSLQIIKWQSKVLNLSEEYDSLMTFLSQRYPEYYNLKYDNNIVGTDEIQKKLESNSILVEYSLTDTILYTFVITKNDFEILETLIDSSFYIILDQVIKLLRDNNFGNTSYEQFLNYIDNACYLYEKLFGSSSLIEKGKRLIIVTDNQLGFLPFEALLTSKPENPEYDFRILPYLILDHPVCYSYSATMLMQNKDIEVKSDIRVLAFAPTYEHIKEIDTAKFVASRDYLTYLVPLKFVKDELAGIDETVESDLFIDQDATEDIFWEKASDYDILHFAMHTLINNDDPMYSQLVFTLSNDTSENSDGLLNTYEIYNSDLNARLAVLSACNTGYGKLQKGEGIMSLARGFFYAGVPSVVMTLWAVEDRSGADLMKKFYNNLKQEYNIDVALQQAKIDYLEESDKLMSHPYLWSGYVSIGNPQAIYRSSSNVMYVIIILSVVVLVIGGWVFRSRKSVSRKS